MTLVDRFGIHKATLSSDSYCGSKLTFHNRDKVIAGAS
jgi:hypothetical protein